MSKEASDILSLRTVLLFAPSFKVFQDLITQTVRLNGMPGFRKTTTGRANIMYQYFQRYRGQSRTLCGCVLPTRLLQWLMTSIGLRAMPHARYDLLLFFGLCSAHNSHIYCFSFVTTSFVTLKTSAKIHFFSIGLKKKYKKNSKKRDVNK